MNIPEILDKVVSFLSLQDLLVCSQVSRLWYHTSIVYIYQTVSPKSIGRHWYTILDVLYSFEHNDGSYHPGEYTESDYAMAKILFKRHHHLLRHVDTVPLPFLVRYFLEGQRPQQEQQQKEEQQDGALGPCSSSTSSPSLLPSAFGSLKSLKIENIENIVVRLRLSSVKDIPGRIFDESNDGYNVNENPATAIRVRSNIITSRILWQVIWNNRTSLERIEVDGSSLLLQYLKFESLSSDASADTAKDLAQTSTTATTPALVTSLTRSLSSPGGVFLTELFKSMPKVHHLKLPAYYNVMQVLAVLANLSATTSPFCRNDHEDAKNPGTRVSGVRSLFLYDLPIREEIRAINNENPPLPLSLLQPERDQYLSLLTNPTLLYDLPIREEINKVNPGLPPSLQQQERDQYLASLINSTIRDLTVRNAMPWKITVAVKIMPALETLTIWNLYYVGVREHSHGTILESIFEPIVVAREKAVAASTSSAQPSITTAVQGTLAGSHNFASTTTAVRTLRIESWILGLLHTSVLWENLIEFVAPKQHLLWGLVFVLERMPRVQIVRLGGRRGGPVKAGEGGEGEDDEHGGPEDVGPKQNLLTWFEYHICESFKDRMRAVQHRHHNAAARPLSVRFLFVNTILSPFRSGMEQHLLPQMNNLIQLELRLVRAPVLQAIATHCRLLERLRVDCVGYHSRQLNSLMIQCSRLKSLRGQGLAIRAMDMVQYPWTCLGLEELECALKGIPVLTPKEKRTLELFEEKEKEKMICAQEALEEEKNSDVEVQQSEQVQHLDDADQILSVLCGAKGYCDINTPKAEKEQVAASTLYSLRRQRTRSLEMQQLTLKQLSRLHHLRFLNLSPTPVHHEYTHLTAPLFPDPTTLDWTLESGLDLKFLQSVSKMEKFQFLDHELEVEQVKAMLDHWPCLKAFPDEKGLDSARQRMISQECKIPFIQCRENLPNDNNSPPQSTTGEGGRRQGWWGTSRGAGGYGRGRGRGQ
ncbi:hypothetical protein BGZ83_001142 [Gryganskiella cystojenkinii]|nr:hypothetical protein BGZ83_001142 [Gryganskiella cystojenkinii]